MIQLNLFKNQVIFETIVEVADYEAEYALYKYVMEEINTNDNIALFLRYFIKRQNIKYTKCCNKCGQLVDLRDPHYTKRFYMSDMIDIKDINLCDIELINKTKNPFMYLSNKECIKCGKLNNDYILSEGYTRMENLGRFDTHIREKLFPKHKLHRLLFDNNILY